jgi:diguanylate cyclase (GGDEF)-like protein
MQMNKGKERAIYRRFIISISLTSVLFLSVIFSIVSVTNRKLIYEQARAEARALFHSIVMARKWNAHYGGVYVEKRPGMESNPYLEDPDIKTLDGRTFTKKNPALMTREISEYAGREGLFTFHITSLNPLNPNNKPDEFEARALRLFEKGEKEAFEEKNLNSGSYFRYMAPLYVEKDCLQCHAKQGYRLGEIRGGISISFDIREIINIQKTNTTIIVSLAILTIAALLGFLFLFTLRLTKKISDAHQQIEKMAIADVLTGLFNRRHVLERFSEEMTRAKRLKKDLGCVMIDIDNFKTINDTYGHLVGDKTLREVSDILNNSIRTYDIAGRYGGEEFLIILPDTPFQDTLGLAERIRKNIKESPIAQSELTPSIPVTISLGLASMIDKDISIDNMIKRADDGLYMAKNSGRDKVAWVEPEFF